MTYPVSGWCPYGCGDSLLFLVENGHITCTNEDCPQPDAVHLLLQEAQETRHIVNIERSPYSDEYIVTIQHPIMERCAGELFSCEMVPFRFVGYPPGRHYAEIVGHGRLRVTPGT